MKVKNIYVSDKIVTPLNNGVDIWTQSRGSIHEAREIFVCLIVKDFWSGP